MFSFLLLLGLLYITYCIKLPQNQNELNVLFNEKNLFFSKINKELLYLEEEREKLRNEFTKITNKNDWNIQKIIFLNNRIEKLKKERRDLNHEILLIENEIRNDNKN